ncbi:imidazole glycerol phosphate synthase subunit HisH [Dermabacteraceae bacterium P13077]
MSRAPRVVVLDYGSGNVRSAVRALAAQGAEVTLSADPVLVQEADGLVVPGVGAFAAAMQQLRACGADRLIERRLAGGGPVLGICVGMQIMFSEGREHGIFSEGLAQWPGSVTRLEADVLPHMGWNTVTPAQDSRLFAGIADERFYFVHSYGVTQWHFDPLPGLRAPLVTWGEHGGQRFIAAVENGPLAATQFHPEKSGEAGGKLLRNWLDSLPRNDREAGSANLRGMSGTQC